MEKIPTPEQVSYFNEEKRVALYKFLIDEKVAGRSMCIDIRLLAACVSSREHNYPVACDSDLVYNNHDEPLPYPVPVIILFCPARLIKFPVVAYVEANTNPFDSRDDVLRTIGYGHLISADRRKRWENKRNKEEEKKAVLMIREQRQRLLQQNNSNNNNNDNNNNGHSPWGQQLPLHNGNNNNNYPQLQNNNNNNNNDNNNNGNNNQLVKYD